MSTPKKTAEAAATKHALTTQMQTELIVREGQAPKIYENKIINLSGTIDAPRKFLEKRKADHEKQAVHVVYSRDRMEIVLVLDEREHFSTTVTGKMVKNPDLVAYGINSESKMYTIAELQKFLRMRRAHFSDRDKNTVIVTNLARFKANVSTELEQMKTTRGEEKQLKETTIKTDLAMDFELTMPILKGGAAKTFKVEICFQVRDAQVDVWLESPELQEIFDTERDGLIDAELQAFKDYVVIEQ